MSLNTHSGQPHEGPLRPVACMQVQTSKGVACFGDLPLPLALRIVCEALGAEGATLCAWLQLSLVCKAWRELMRPECIALALPSDDVPTAQWQALRRWVRTTSVRIGSLQLGAASSSPRVLGESLSSQPTADMQTASAAITRPTQSGAEPK